MLYQQEKISPNKGIWCIDDNKHEESPYYAKILKEIQYNKRSWNGLKIGIFKREPHEDILIGEYDRNYPRLMGTFFPFKQGDQWFALYSKSYTATRVMTLPDCKDLCGEENNQWGFCPVQYYVPIEEKDSDFANFGLVSGCIWGDDSSWKVQYLDLSQIKEGKLIREEKFGYIALPDNVDLDECITYYDSEEKEIAIITGTTKFFSLNKLKKEIL